MFNIINHHNSHAWKIFTLSTNLQYDKIKVCMKIKTGLTLLTVDIKGQPIKQKETNEN